MISLDQGQLGSVYYIEGFSKTIESERQLINLGIVKGSQLQLLACHKQEDLIILVKGARIGISHSVAQNLIVREQPFEEISSQPLGSLAIGQTSQVERVLGQGMMRRRLMDMGLTRGVEVVIRKVAPLGDPIEITVRGYELTLRKAEADLVLMKKGS